jgi:hypothetical protein
MSASKSASIRTIKPYPSILRNIQYESVDKINNTSAKDNEIKISISVVVGFLTLELYISNTKEFK